MPKTKILIAVKTYPSLSQKYDELVCTAGFREDGSWIRIYPVPFRKLDYAQQYKKWEWISLDVVKNTSDFRPESYRPADIDSELIRVDTIDARHWEERKKIVLKNVRDNLDDLIAEAKDENTGTSLAVLKPKEIIDFKYKPCEREWDKDKLMAVLARHAQISLFDKQETEKLFKVVRKLPYKFSYIFTTEDGKKRDLMIEDWEVGALYWNMIHKGCTEKEACQAVQKKFFDELTQRDLYFLMGTTLQYHKVAPNPFIIIGVFYPPKEATSQLSLDF